MTAKTARQREVRAFGLWAVIVLLAAFWAFVFLGSGLVRAHQPTHDVSCAGISVSGRAYGHGATLTLTVNGATQTQTRGRDGHFAGLTATFPSTGESTWSFTFDDPDDRYDLTESGVQEGCAGPATTTTVAPTTTTIAPTTTTTLPEETTTTWPSPTPTSPSTSSSTTPSTSSAPPSTTSSLPPGATPSAPPIPTSTRPLTPVLPPPGPSSPPTTDCAATTFDPADPAAVACFRLPETS